MNQIKINVQSVEYQRNGISGRPFHMIRFSFDDPEGGHYKNMIAIMPYEARDWYSSSEGAECFVLNADDLTSHWRGDSFFDECLKAVEKHEG